MTFMGARLGTENANKSAVEDTIISKDQIVHFNLSHKLKVAKTWQISNCMETYYVHAILPCVVMLQLFLCAV